MNFPKLIYKCVYADLEDHYSFFDFELLSKIIPSSKKIGQCNDQTIFTYVPYGKDFIRNPF